MEMASHFYHFNKLGFRKKVFPCNSGQHLVSKNSLKGKNYFWPMLNKKGF